MGSEVLNPSIENKATARSKLQFLQAWLARSRVAPYVLLGGVALFALGMRLFDLGRWSLWIDEVYEIHYAQEAMRNLSAITRPSLLVIGGLISSLGVSEWSARLGPALIGVLSIILLFFPFRKLFGRWTALLAVVLIALSPWHLHWSQNARFYTSLLLFYNLGLLIFFFGLERNKTLLLLFSFIALGLAVLERKMALFIVPVVGVYLLALLALRMELPAGVNRRNVIALSLPIALLGLWQVYSVAFAGGEPFYAKFMILFLGHEHSPVRVGLSIVSDLGLPLFIMALAGGFFLLRKRSRAGIFLLASAVVPVVLLVAGAPFAQTFSRYVFLALPSWALLAAYAMVSLLRQVKGEYRWLALGVLAIMLIEPVSQDLLYYTAQNGNRQDWKGAFAVVEKGWQAGDEVVTTRTEIGEYYLPGMPVTWTQGLKPKNIPKAGQRVWFVIDDRTGFVSPELNSFLQNNTRLVSVNDVYIPGLPMIMRVYLYDPAALLTSANGGVH